MNLQQYGRHVNQVNDIWEVQMTFELVFIDYELHNQASLLCEVSLVADARLGK